MSTTELALLPLDVLSSALTEVCRDAAWMDMSTELINGGKSNLTFRLRSTAGELILRRPPTGQLLPSAHDMAREARVQAALDATDVPTARILLVDKGAMLGFPFYVMEKVDGHVVRDQLPAGYAETEAERKALCNTFVDSLAALHAVDYREIGLEDFGNPDGFLNRQVRRWTSQWQASRFGAVQELDELASRLASTVPDQQRVALIHGDYRLDNVVLDLCDPGSVRAVLDWELSTLGDPATDLALLLLFWRGDGEPASSLVPGVSHLPGFPNRDYMVERYLSKAGVDAPDLNWYLAFAHFKFAVITQGVFARSKAGAMGGQDFGDLRDEVLGLGQRGLELLPRN
ncbi:phosphotransferase family protein [Saccharopolyspora pogona]|uniref:phosphotransferase family protein n=1 Tax=Saccharopolyspora pogona TaxID=333966 RepID=UPI0016863E01|nr:phosphotransferase family protein [Saccharopolyspora pogona]